MKKKFIIILSVAILALLLFWFVSGRDKTGVSADISDIQQPVRYQTSPEITVEDLYHYISVLASDSLEGREAGTLGEKKAISFICGEISDYGLNSQLQPFTFAKRDLTWYDCTLSFGNFRGEMNRDFIPILPIASSRVSGETVFAGYGYNYSKNGKEFNDYKDVDVHDKWAIIFEGTHFDGITPRAGQSLEKRYDTAQKNGAAGVLTICQDSASGGQLVPDDWRYSTTPSSKFLIPMVRISGKTADSLLRYAGSSVSEALANIREKQWNVHIPVKVNVSVNSRRDSLISSNIIAFMEGADSILKKEYIIVGAHYDHVGMDTYPTITGDTTTINYGADDNASGTAGVMELAEKLVSADKQKRSILFVLFGAEEQGGLPGSKYFSENSPVPLDKIKLMINLDMIGRMDSLKNTYIYTDTQNSMLLKKAGSAYPDILLNIDTKNKGKSDHLSFSSKSIPIAYFTTGTHSEYHTPKDKTNTINFEGQKQLLDLIYDFICLKADAVEN
ncbi:MAG: M20/M25/M40 family metallo-hydrolase [Tannerella sp.]|jgi:hypothetical protein|nr:M20/M25/M40 family metallo-hydrolase [Tannerella sp.]